MRAHRRRKFGAPDGRPASIDRFDFGQQRLAVAGARHRAHGADGRERGLRAEISALVGRQFAMDQRKAGVAAEDRASVPRQAVVKAARQRIDADDRGDAERDAGQKNTQAREPAAQIAQGEPQDWRQKGEARLGGRSRFAHCAAMASSRYARPQADRAVAARSEIEIMRDQHQRRPALRAADRTVESMIARPVASSRLPVGSSAISREGRGASARASATRCCSPPESWAG